MALSEESRRFDVYQLKTGLCIDFFIAGVLIY
jgi:hypothetical protein